MGRLPSASFAELIEADFDRPGIAFAPQVELVWRPLRTRVPAPSAAAANDASASAPDITPATPILRRAGAFVAATIPVAGVASALVV